MDFFQDHQEFSDTEEETRVDCDHKNTANHGSNEVCIDCNFIVSSTDSKNCNSVTDVKRCHQRANETKTIENDVKNKNFPKSIIENANILYNQVVKDKLFRGDNRKAIIVMCIYKSYDKGTESLDSIRLKFNLNKSCMKKGRVEFLKAFPELANDYITPKDLIRSYMIKSNIDLTHLSDIYKLYDDIEQQKSKLFNSSKPQSIAASLIYLYLCTKPEYKKRMNFTRFSFANNVGLSELTISKLGKEFMKMLQLNISSDEF